MKKVDIAMQKWHKEMRMKKLITAAMERFDPADLLELMYEQCCNQVQREYLKEKMIDTVILEGGMFIKNECLGLDKKDKLESFLNTEIFPAYNEQKGNILFY